MEGVSMISGRGLGPGFIKVTGKALGSGFRL